MLEIAEPRLAVESLSATDIAYLAPILTDLWVVERLIDSGHSLVSWCAFTGALVAEFGLDKLAL